MDAFAPRTRLRERSVLESGQFDYLDACVALVRNGSTGPPPCLIYQPARSVMQAGSRGTRDWILEFEPWRKRWVEPLMGWTVSEDPYAQIRLTFPSREAAARHAQRLGLDFRVKAPVASRRRPKGYVETIVGGSAG